jgi:hypothetical protein
MSETTSLFDSVDPSPRLGDLSGPPIARATDPSTSHEAAEELTSSGERQRMMAVTLDGLRLHPGLTAKELEERLGFSDGAVRKRLNDLRHAGHATNGLDRVCSLTGKKAQTWFSVE